MSLKSYFFFVFFGKAFIYCRLTVGYYQHFVSWYQSEDQQKGIAALVNQKRAKEKNIFTSLTLMIIGRWRLNIHHNQTFIRIEVRHLVWNNRRNHTAIFRILSMVVEIVGLELIETALPPLTILEPLRITLGVTFSHSIQPS